MNMGIALVRLHDLWVYWKISPIIDNGFIGMIFNNQ